MTTKTPVTDTDIRAAVASQGFADAAITRQVIPYHPGNDGECGTWFNLFVVFRDGMAPVLWGRRRTMADLLSLAQRGPLFD